MGRFVIGDNDFELDGQPFRILSGAIHYFRVHPEHWRSRIRAARDMGLNTIETYVAWNQHEPSRGSFDFEGGRDLGAFLDAVAAEGMLAIVRPGPYICAEFDNGGLPYWLTRIPDIALRSRDPLFLDAVDQYLAELAPILVPRLISAGGPIVLLQVENEYGAYGNDSVYIRHLATTYATLGFDVPYVTVDQPTDEMLSGGGVPEIHKTGSFGSEVKARLRTLRRHQPTGPLMCGEFWIGWFDDWGSHHHTTSTEVAAQNLDVLLASGASVNVYMFHGGTNLGLTNGANHKGRYNPISTSYDYDAPLDEAGRYTAKFWAFREVISRYAPVPEMATPTVPVSLELTVPLSEQVSLASVLGKLGDEIVTETLASFDGVDTDGRLALYTAEVATRHLSVLELGEVRDRAWVFTDGRPVGALARDSHERSLLLPPIKSELSILVEDQGRVNYGARLGEPKGLIGPASIDGVEIGGWRMRPLDLARVPQLKIHGTAGDLDGPALWRGTFEIEEPQDLFLSTAGWGKGFVWVNEVLLGRYWRRGPQQTLYVPGPLVHSGINAITVLELEVMTGHIARFVAEHDLGPTES